MVWPPEPCAEEIPEPLENPELPEEPEFAWELEPPDEPDDTPLPEPEPPEDAALPVPLLDEVPLAVLACDDPGRT
jgi:hypothetical protein